jgi:hypothetical protein
LLPAGGLALMAPLLSEHDIQRAYIIWARGVLRPDDTWNVEPALLPGVICWSVPNGGNRDGFEAKRLKEEGVLAGIPDVHHLWGRLICTEFKKPGGVLSPAQRLLIPQLIAAGATVEVVDSLADAKNFARRCGIVREGF